MVFILVMAGDFTIESATVANGSMLSAGWFLGLLAWGIILISAHSLRQFIFPGLLLEIGNALYLPLIMNIDQYKD